MEVELRDKMKHGGHYARKEEGRQLKIQLAMYTAKSWKAGPTFAGASRARAKEKPTPHKLLLSSEVGWESVIAVDIQWREQHNK